MKLECDNLFHDLHENHQDDYKNVSQPRKGTNQDNHWSDNQIGLKRHVIKTLFSLSQQIDITVICAVSLNSFYFGYRGLVFALLHADEEPFTW